MILLPRIDPWHGISQRADTCDVQEVQVLARCHSKNITQYYASVLQPGTTELMIVMELMAASVYDVVSYALKSHCRPACCIVDPQNASQAWFWRMIKPAACS